MHLRNFLKYIENHILYALIISAAVILFNTAIMFKINPDAIFSNILLGSIFGVVLGLFVEYLIIYNRLLNELKKEILEFNGYDEKVIISKNLLTAELTVRVDVNDEFISIEGITSLIEHVQSKMDPYEVNLVIIN